VRLTSPDDVEQVTARAREHGVVALDTEFMRERTYWPRLCLVQLAVADEAWLLDPIEGGDVRWLEEMMTDPGIVKILHAGQQDLEILYRAFGRTAAPVFDTQVAATLAGFPTQVGYARLIEELFGERVDKSDTFTDWARRPLAATQVEYALNDVRHLPGAYRVLVERLQREGRLAWLEEDFERLASPEAFEIVPETQFLRVKRASSLNRRQLGVLREIAAWREREAQRRDLPKRWVVSDESLIEVARRMPSDASQLSAIRGINARSFDSSTLLQAVARGQAVPEAELPRMPRKPKTIVDVEGIVELMGALVRVRASEHGIAVPLLAGRQDLERLASGERADSPLLSGWRRSLIGEELLELAEGRLALRVADGKIVVDEAGDARP
jgi:ribonuclease D